MMSGAPLPLPSGVKLGPPEFVPVNGASFMQEPTNKITANAVAERVNFVVFIVLFIIVLNKKTNLRRLFL
jgi:hypothetical protein